jgi:hypothetical protein
VTKAHRDSSLVVDTDLDPQEVVEKRPKALSAAQAKRQPKPPPTTNWLNLGPVPDGPRYDHFTCIDCRKETPVDERGDRIGANKALSRCKACVKLASDRQAGTARYFYKKSKNEGGGVSTGFEATKRKVGYEKTKRKYKKAASAKLPAWMFS